MAYSALKIACYFLNRSLNEDPYMTNMKLQKMVYIANGLNLAAYGEPLILERVEVWAYGPVVEPVYHYFKKFGNDPIGRRLPDCDLFHKLNPKETDLQVLDATWIMCKDLTGIQLSNWTHEADSPWTKAKDLQKNFIPDSLLIDYFKKYLKQN